LKKKREAVLMVDLPTSLTRLLKTKRGADKTTRKAQQKKILEARMLVERLVEDPLLAEQVLSRRAALAVAENERHELLRRERFGRGRITFLAPQGCVLMSPFGLTQNECHKRSDPQLMLALDQGGTCMLYLFHVTSRVEGSIGEKAWMWGLGGLNRSLVPDRLIHFLERKHVLVCQK